MLLDQADLIGSPPQVPSVASLTGTWLTTTQATDPGYWGAQLREPTQFARGVETVDFWRVRHPAVPPGLFPEVDRLREGVLELPVHQDLSPADAEHVASCVRELLR